MLARWRLKRFRAKFLESCRSLREGRGYWAGTPVAMRRLLGALLPVPLLALHEEGRGLLSALEWLEAHCRSTPLGEDVLRTYHRLARPEGSAPGQYRQEAARVDGAAVPLPPPERVPALMAGLDVRLRDAQRALDGRCPAAESEVVALASDAYLRIGLIHPFADGNGRVARLAMNHVLRRYGAGYAVLPALDEAGSHWEALEAARAGNPERLEGFVRDHLFRV